MSKHHLTLICDDRDDDGAGDYMSLGLDLILTVLNWTDFGQHPWVLERTSTPTEEMSPDILVVDVDDDAEWFCNDCSTYFIGGVACPNCDAPIDFAAGYATSEVKS